MVIRGQFLTSASMISWLSKQNMVIVMFLKLVVLFILGNGVVKGEFQGNPKQSDAKNTTI